MLRPGNRALRDSVEPGRRAGILAVVDEGVAEANPAFAGELREYCEAHADALELAAAPLVLPGGEAVKNHSGHVEQLRAIRVPPLALGSRIVRRKLGFRTLLDVIPLDASLVKALTAASRPTRARARC